MSQEKHQMCNNGGASGLGRPSSRKIKQNKIPQRGLGVEKLERIRLEEQRKNGGIGPRPVIPAPLSRPRPRPSPGPVVGVPLRPPPQFQSSSSSIPYHPSASLANLSSLASAPSVAISSSASLLPIHPPNVPRNHPYVHNMSHIGSSSSSGGPPAFRWPLGAIDDGSVDYGSTLKSENTRFDTEYADGSSSDLDDPSKHSWPPLLQTQSRQSIVNGPLSASPSSGLNFQPEPPSNQNAYGNYLPPPFYHEDKMVGMKRSWPYAFDNPPDRLYPTNVPSIPYPYRRLDEFYGNGNHLAREGPTATGYPLQSVNWMGSSSHQLPNKRLKEKAALDGDLLSLVPPVTNSIPSSSTIPKLKQPLAIPPPDYHELAKIELPLFRSNFAEEMLYPKDFMQQHYNQFTSKEQQNIGQATSPKEQPTDDLDLDLKL